jgi:hypothetical protein
MILIHVSGIKFITTISNSLHGKGKLCITDKEESYVVCAILSKSFVLMENEEASYIVIAYVMVITP